jgi:hypothetical protein
MLQALTDNDFLPEFQVKPQGFILVYFYKSQFPKLEYLLNELSNIHQDVVFYVFNLSNYPNIRAVAATANINLDANSIITFYNGMPLTVYKGKLTRDELNKFIEEMKREGINEFLDFLKSKASRPTPVLMGASSNTFVNSGNSFDNRPRPRETYNNMGGGMNTAAPLNVYGPPPALYSPHVTLGSGTADGPGGPGRPLYNPSRTYETSGRQFQSLRNTNIEKLQMYEQDLASNHFDKWSGMMGGPIAKEKIWVSDIRKE